MGHIYSHNGGTVTHVKPLPSINHCDRQVPQVLSKRCVCRASRWGSDLQGGLSVSNCPLQLSLIRYLYKGNKSSTLSFI